MKKFFKLMMVAMMAMATVGLVACEDDNGGQPGPVDEPSYETLVGTEWEGVFATRDQAPGYTQNPLNIHWTIDFLKDGKGELMFWLESPGYDPDPYTFPITYTYDGDGVGKIDPWEYGDAGSFFADPYNRTLVVKNLTVEIGETAESGYTYGGETTLHQVR